MMSCYDCQANLDDVAVGDPCPACGSVRRSADPAPESFRVTTVFPRLGLKVTKGDNRPWTEKWQAVLHSLDGLTAAYSGDVPELGNVAVDQLAMTFFLECNHLRDWLSTDPASGVSAKEIWAHVESSDPLGVCNALCNTHKHRTRRPGQATARIRDTSITPRVRVTIEVNWATAEATKVDALDLANDCVSSWRKFFTTFGITEP